MMKSFTIVIMWLEKLKSGLMVTQAITHTPLLNSPLEREGKGVCLLTKENWRYRNNLISFSDVP